MDSIKIARYIGLAQQSNGILSKPPPELAASLTFISVVLFDAKVRRGAAGSSRNLIMISSRFALRLACFTTRGVQYLFLPIIFGIQACFVGNIVGSYYGLSVSSQVDAQVQGSDSMVCCVLVVR